MALKKKIDKAAYEKLSDAMKAEYIADGENFKLDLTDDEDTGPLKRALEREKQEARDRKQRVEELEAELESLSTNDAKKKGDIATLEKGWQAKLDAQKNEYEGKIGKLTNHVTKNLIDNQAMALATELAGKNAKILLPHITARLKADFEGDEPVARILDASGKVSAATLADLKGEFVANKDFSGIITASNASGGGAPANNANNPAGGAKNFNQNQQPTNLAKASPKDLVALVNAKKAEAN